MSIALPTLHDRETDPVPVPTRDLVIAVAITGTLIIATVATAAVGPMPRTGAAIMDLGLLSLAVRRMLPLPAIVATAVVVPSTVVIAPDAVKAPVLFAVALAVYSLVRYASGVRLLTGLVIGAGGVAVARLFLPAPEAHGVTITQLEAILIVGPAVVAAAVRWRGRLPELRGDDRGDDRAVDSVVDRGADQSGADHSSADHSSDHLLELGRGLGRLASWVEFGRVNRDRMLSSVAAGLVLLVLLLHGGSTDAVRDGAAIGLAVVAAGSVALVGRWPWPALLVALVAAVLFSAIASLPDAYDSVIGGVVVIGLPLMVGGTLRLRPASIALATCMTASVVMGLVTRADSARVLGPGISCQELLSSVALVVGAWSAGRVLRSAAQLAAGAGRAAAAVAVPVREPVGGLLPEPAVELGVAGDRAVGRSMAAGSAGQGPSGSNDHGSNGHGSDDHGSDDLGLRRAGVGERGDEGPSGRPSLPDAATLVHRVSALGLRPTTIRVDQAHGEHLPQRIVEVVGEILDEALLNAARHAPGAELMIKVLREAKAIRIEVINSCRTGASAHGSGSGHGVPALARRIAEIGGMFLVGPASGGFALRALLPLDDQAAGRDVGRVVAVTDHDPGAGDSPAR